MRWLVLLTLLFAPSIAWGQSGSQELPTIEVSTDHVRVGNEGEHAQHASGLNVGARIALVSTGSVLFTASYTIALIGGFAWAVGCCRGFDTGGAALVLLPVFGPMLAAGVEASQQGCFNCVDGGLWGAAFIDSVVQVASIALIVGGSAGRLSRSRSNHETAWLAWPGVANSPFGLTLTIANY